LQEAGRPACRLVQLQPEVDLLRWQEDVTATRHRLDWVLTAELKPSSPSVFAYSILLDRRLTIEDVSVRENNVDQLLRWSKTPMIGSSQSRLTVFLNRETTTASELKILGSLRMRPSSPVKLPSVRFETAEPLPGTLTLSHEAGYRLELSGRAAIEESAEGDDGVAPASVETPPKRADDDRAPGAAIPLRFAKRLRISEGDVGLDARLEPLAGPCRVQMLWAVIPDGNQSRIRSWWELTPQPGTREISIAVPDWLQLSHAAVLDDGPPPTEWAEDGKRHWQIKCREDGTPPRLLAIDAELSEPDQRVWRQALPNVLQSIESEVYAAVPPHSKWVIPGEATNVAELVRISLHDRLAEWQLGGVEAISRITGDVLLLERTDTRLAAAGSSSVLIDHQLVPGLDAGWIGESDFYPIAMNDALEITLPHGLEQVVLLADGEPLPTEETGVVGPAEPAIVTPTRRMRVQDVGRFRRLSLRWRSPGKPPSNAIFGSGTLNLPQCANAEAVSYVTLRSSRDDWRLAPRDGKRIDPWELSCERLEALLMRYRQRRPDAPRDSDLLRELWREYRRAASELPVHDTETAMTEPDRGRWQALSAEMSQIEDPGSAAEIVPASSASPAWIHTETNGPFRYWRVRSELLDGIAAAGLLLAGWWTLPILVAVQFAPWLERRRSAGWFIFGLAWFCFWSPAIFGLALMAWAVAQGFWRRPKSVAVNPV
jgi:hypothetical protein